MSSLHVKQRRGSSALLKANIRINMDEFVYDPGSSWGEPWSLDDRPDDGSMRKFRPRGEG